MLFQRIRLLRIIALLLFIVPAIGLIGSLLIHNYLVSFNFQKMTIYPIKGNVVGETALQLCNSENNYCDWKRYNLADKLNNCHPYKIKRIKVNIEDGKVSIIDENFDFEKHSKPFFKKFETSNEKNENCILNSKVYKYYNLIPFLFEKTYEIKSNKNFSLGTSEKINPIFFGESSISNIVKRFPINYVFKITMFISSILMILYWSLYFKIFNLIFNKKGIHSFYIYGLLSSFFLFLHTFFLGTNIENEILMRLRRIYVVFFILFEILAQVYLIKKILDEKKLLQNYLNEKIIITKLYFVRFICVLTVIILSLFTIFTLDSRLDYIVEWNYFLILLVFYFLSFLIWKKKLLLNPSTT